MHLKISENKDCIYIDAKDITALRASTNAILRGFQVIGTLQQFRKTKIKVKIYKYKAFQYIRIGVFIALRFWIFKF